MLDVYLFRDLMKSLRLCACPVKKAEQERKRLQSIYAPMLYVLSCVSLAGKAKLSQNVRERVLSLEVKM